MGLTIGVLAGGTPKAIACHPEIIGAQLAVVADVAKELALLKLDHDKALPLPLSHWGTVAALVAEAKACGLALSPDLDKLLPRLPTASLEEGMCQVAFWGDLAIRVLEAQGRLEELKDEVFKRALQIAEGELTSVRIVEAESQAGGTGKGAGPRLARVLVQTFLDRSPATVIWERLYIGNLTFVGLGNNVLPNAVHLWADVAHVMNGDRNPRELRELWLTELPLRQREKPIGAQKEIRDALVGALSQALFSSTVRDEVGRRRSNRSFEHPLGALKIVRADFGDFLGEEPLLLAGATHHLLALRTLEEDIPTEDVCMRVEVPLEENGHWRGGEPKDVAELIRTSLEKPGLFQTEIWATPDYRGRIVVFFAKDESSLFDTLLHTSSPSSPEEYLRTRCQYASLKRVVTEELDREREKRTIAEAALTEATAALKWAIGVLYPETWWEKVVSFLSSLWPWADDPVLAFERALSRYRSAATEALQSRARVVALGGALAQLEAERARYKGEIDRMIAFLERFSQGASRSTALVVFKPLDAVFAALLQTAGAQDQGRLKQLLRCSIGGVTQKGLAQIVGVKETDLREVLSKLATGTPPYRGPMWGGRSDRKPPRHRFFVLPPLEPQTREGVFREAVAAGLSSQVVVAEADTLVAGLTVVALEVYEVERLDEVFTALYGHYAKKALDSESRPLFEVPDRSYETVCHENTT